MLAKIINECDGVMVKVAHRLRVHRSTMYSYCDRFDLWKIFNAVRRDRLMKAHEQRRKKYRGGIMV